MNISIIPKNERIAGGSEIRTMTVSSHKADEKQKIGKQDKVTISLQAQNLLNKNGGKKTMLERLMEQKQNIIDRRSDYISKAMEKGTSPDAMKYELGKIDAQIEELDKQVQELQLEGLRKATGIINGDPKEEENNNEIRSNNSVDSKHGALVLTSNTMKELISSSNEMKQVTSVKLAQLTLERESKAWGSNPERSEKLKVKAAGLDGELIQMSQNANHDITHAIEKDKKDNIHHQPIENEDLDITEQVEVN